MAAALQAVRGMNDVLPDEAMLWQRFEDVSRNVFERYGYRNLRVPIVEPTPLFVRSIGAHTDVVEHEMYTFEDKLNGESLTLRPEATAGIVRAAIEHHLTYERPQRVWTAGPMFRHERPQRGRYRQFHQLDVEALGFEGPDVDAEQIVMLSRLWTRLGLAGMQLHINTIGDSDERAAHRRALTAYFEAHAGELDEDSRRRLVSNPLRILDSKNPALEDVIAGAPKLVDRLGADSRAHFEGVQALVGDAGVPFEINPRLVRGLDDYNLTVFEWITDRLGAQGTVCGGGRYDGLFTQLGGKPTPAIGWGMGIERMLLLLDAAGVAMPAAAVDVYAIVPGPEALARATATCEALRAAGVAVQMHAAAGDGPGSMKSQFRKADASGARHALIFGTDETSRGEVGLKDLRNPATPQIAVPIEPIEGLLSRLASAAARPS